MIFVLVGGSFSILITKEAETSMKEPLVDKDTFYTFS